MALAVRCRDRCDVTDYTCTCIGICIVCCLVWHLRPPFLLPKMIRRLLLRERNLIWALFLISNELTGAFVPSAPSCRKPRPCLAPIVRIKRLHISRIARPTTRKQSTRLDASKSKRQSYPEWPRPWMPSWLLSLRPRNQLLLAILFYVFHLQVLTQRALPFPFQLIPNDQGRFQSIGLDSLAGIIALCSYLWIRRSKIPPVPSILSKPTKKNAPWRFSPQKKGSIRPGPRSTGLFCFILLVQAYFLTGRFAIFWEDVFYAAAGLGFPLTIAMHRSLCVLFGHLTWVAVGALILRIVPRPQPFFGGGSAYPEEPDDDDEEDNDYNDVKPVKKPLKYKWYTSTWKTNWLWWTVGGYFVSSWMFNIADFVNQMVLPTEILETAAEGVVSQLINPEHNDLAASIVGCIAPCISAPWWEEVLYRGFMLPAMCLHMSFWPSVLVSGLVFSAHHISATGAIPLAVLGWTWATIYAKSGNLLVTILIHAMWNSRVFLGSWLGL